MSKQKRHSLDTVVESIAQLIAVTKQWILSTETRSTEQLVRKTERIKALENLEKQVRKELRSTTRSSERVWQLIDVVVATVTRYALDQLHDSIRYQISREQLKYTISIFTANHFKGRSNDRQNYQVPSSG